MAQTHDCDSGVSVKKAKKITTYLMQDSLQFVFSMLESKYGFKCDKTHFQSNTGVNRAIFVKNKPKHTVNVIFSSNICSQWQDARFFCVIMRTVPRFLVLSHVKQQFFFLESGF